MEGDVNKEGGSQKMAFDDVSTRKIGVDMQDSMPRDTSDQGTGEKVLKGRVFDG